MTPSSLTPTHVTRRGMMLGSVAAALAQGCASTKAAPAAKRTVLGDPRIQGPFPILSTPFTESGEVDYEVLAKEAQFVDKCGSPGMIWPQSDDSLDLLTNEEKLKGMEALAAAMRGRRSALCLGVQGKTTEDMLIFARHAEKLAPAAFISRPPDLGKTEDDMRTYWRELAKVTKRPVIIQTTGGKVYKGPVPPVKLLVEQAKELPNFGYIKEEANPIMTRMRELVAAKPTILRVFSAWSGFGWLHQTRQVGTEGLITERAVYADLLTYIWEKMVDDNDPLTAQDAFSKFLLMLNLRETMPGNQLRAFHLYVWIKRGVFKNMLSREYGPNHSRPEKPKLSEHKLSQSDMAEIDSRFESLKPYLKA